MHVVQTRLEKASHRIGRTNTRACLLLTIHFDGGAVFSWKEAPFGYNMVREAGCDKNMPHVCRPNEILPEQKLVASRHNMRNLSHGSCFFI